MERSCFMKVTRCQALIVTASMLVSKRPADAQSPLTAIRVISNPVSDVVPLLYAQRSGLFRDAGLDVTLEKASSGSAVAEAIVGGATEIGKVPAVPLITAHARGLPLTILFPDRLHTFGPQSQTALVVATNSTIRTGRDLNGKTISVSAVKDSTWIGARLFIDANGGDSRTVRFVELPFSAVSAAVTSGRIDAGVSNDPYLVRDVDSGAVRSMGDLLGSMGANFLETAWVATADYVAKNRDTVDRFVRAIRAAQVWCNSHATEADDLVAQFTGIDRASVAATKTVFATSVDPSVMQPYIGACAKYDIIPRAFKADDVFMKAS